jgi:transcriptional regulator with XRE-family HTH domain
METEFWKAFKGIQEVDIQTMDPESMRSWARRCGIDVNVLLGWKRGAIPKVATLRKVANKLGVSEKEFYRWVGAIS